MSDSALLPDLDPTAMQLIADGVARVDFPVDYLLPPVIDGWAKFREKTLKEKNRWTFTNLDNFDDPGGKFEGADDGYIYRQGDINPMGEAYDLKEFFHYKSALEKMLKDAEVDTSAETKWLKCLKRLHDKCVEHYLEVTQSLDVFFPEKHLLERAMRGVELGLPTLRLLCYKQAQVVGENIGKMHTDRDWLTIHLADSVPGLVYDSQRGRVEYVKEPNKVLIFPGKKAEKLCDPLIRGLPHGVIATPESVGKRRWTVVFFGHNDVFLTEEDKHRY